MFMRAALCLSLLLTQPISAQPADIDPALVDELIEVAEFDAHVSALRAGVIDGWLATGTEVPGLEDDPDWRQAALDANDPALVAAEFREGVLSVDYPASLMIEAIDGLGDPLGQRLIEMGVEAVDTFATAPDLPETFAADDPRIQAADRVLELRSTVDTALAFRIGLEEAYFRGLHYDDRPDEAEVADYMADWIADYESTRPQVTLAWRQIFFLISDGLDPDERAA